MSKLGNWRAPNWYWDQGFSKKQVLELMRRQWKHCRRVAQQRAKPQPKRWWWPEGEYPHDRAAVEFRAMVQRLTEEREQARQARQFDVADAIRDRLVSLGVEVRDGRLNLNG